MFTTKPVWHFFRFLLYPFALLYGLVIWLRNRLYDSGFFSSVAFNVPVINVGNLSVGGTGKTPHVEYLIRLLQYPYRVATMSRGYKRHTRGFLLANAETNALHIGDEPMQYLMKYPDVLVSVAEERMTGIPTLLQKRPDVEVVLLDDAFQHRSVQAGLNILITDFAKPYYADQILPMGTLRESKSAARRADVIIVSKCPADLTEAAAMEMRQKLDAVAAQEVFFTTMRYGQPYDLLSGAPAAIAGKNAVVVCAIARPETLEAKVAASAAGTHLISYRDHHYFVSSDLEEIKTAADNWAVADKVIVTTEKDAARLLLHRDKLAAWEIPILVLPVEVAFLFSAGEKFDALVNGFVERERAENNWMHEVQVNPQGATGGCMTGLRGGLGGGGCC